MVDLALRGSDAVACHPLRADRVDLGQRPVHLVDVGRRRRGPEGPGELVLDVRDQQAEGRQHARGARDQHGPDADLLGEAASVDRAGPAERDQREVPRVLAALDRDDPERLRHVRVDDAVDAEGGPGHVEPERAGDLRLHCRAREVGVEPDAAGEGLRAQVTEDHARVRDRGLRGRRARSRPDRGGRRRSAVPP